MSASHSVIHDDKNERVLIGIRNGRTGEFKLVPKDEASISVFDSSVLLGDGLWEGIRANQGVIQYAKEHLDRLYEGAKAVMMNIGVTQREMLELLHQTLDANGFETEEGVHIRLVCSRGHKSIIHQNPLVTDGTSTIIIIAEIKKPDLKAIPKGLKLFTVHIRRGQSDVREEQWNHLSKVIDISACIQANVAGADEALMLDLQGNVKTCNSVNFFIVRKGEIWTATPLNQMAGITRQKTIDVARSLGITVHERDFTLTSVYGADEAFVTGTFPSQLPVSEVDGRKIGTGDGQAGPVTVRLQQKYKEDVKVEMAKGREAALQAITS